ncbi:MAG: proline dehydrogenase family protein [Nitrospirota bacterium]|nr:proline dehydrogenase family protein [Nitrospirota bacterium]
MGASEGNQPLQEAVTRIGHAIARHMGAEQPGLFSPAEWKGRIIARAMENDAFRVALFRFVDVLPAVSDDERAMRLAREYFEPLGDSADVLGWGARTLSRGGPFRKVAARVLRKQVGELASQFIAGETVHKALKPLKALWNSGCACSVDLLGEVTVSREEADACGERYLELIATLAQETASWPEHPLLSDDGGPAPRANVSVKLSALEPLLDPMAWDPSLHRAREALRPIFRAAREAGAHVQVDMENHALKDLTLHAFRTLVEEGEFAPGPSCGVVLQSYLKSAPDDLEELAEWARRSERRITVRLVKGAYWDQEVITHRQNGWEVPVWTEKDDTDRCYEQMTVRLLELREWLYPAFGTHNLRSIAHAVARAREMGIADDAYEFQVIYGMAEPMRKALVSERFRVRAYAPVGAFLPGMAYLVRRLLENTANTSVLRRMYGDRQDVDELLVPPPEPMPPAPAREESPRFANEPPADFSTPAARAAMQGALTAVREGLGEDHPALIDGIPVLTGTWIESLNPADGKRVGRVAACGPEQAAQAVAGAVAMFDQWAAVPVAERAAVLRNTAQVLRRDRFDLAALEVYEVGKGWRDADADLTEAIDFLEYYAWQMERLAKPRRVGTQPGESNRAEWLPRGVTAVIAPWNFPIAIACGMVGAALVCGNPVVFKPSERSPVCASRLVAAFREGGVPDGVLQFLPGMGPEAGFPLVEHPDVALIAFTGSREVGLAINEAAARASTSGAHSVKRVIAEMGGKNAIIVDETADLDEAVLGIIHSALGYQGQKCSACSRVIALSPIHDRLVERLVAALRVLPVGPPDDPDSRIGPMVDARARRKVEAYFEVARREGHPAWIGDSPGGCYAAPAVFTGIRAGHRIAREEVFGPIISVLRAESLDQAIHLANDCDYALTGGLYSRSPRAVKQVTDRLLVGNLYVNRGITGALVGRQPFGGFRLSGAGSKTGGEEYLPQFLVPRVVTENTLRRGFAPDVG